MPSIPVQIMALAQSQEQAPVPTVISLRLLDHTLDGIMNVVGLLLFLLNLNFLLAERNENKNGSGIVQWNEGDSTTYLSSASDMVRCVLI